MADNDNKSGLEQLEEKFAKAIQAAETKAAEVVSEIVAEVTKVEDAVVAEAKAVKEKVIGCYQAVFGFALHDPTQGVTVSPTDPTEAEHTEWIQGQIDAGTIVEVKS